MTLQISVVMPVRDGARWLGEAIASVRRQSFADFELIIVDDGSRDDTLRILDDSRASDPRIRVIRQERLGLVPALNRAIAEARGRLIARLDADDRVHPDRLERQRRYLEEHPEIGLLGTWAHTIDEQGSQRGALEPATQPVELAQLLTRTNPFLHSSIMTHRALLKTIGGYRPAFEGAEDYDLWLRISEAAKVANLPERLLQYRVHPGGVTHRARARQLFSARLARRAAEARRLTGHDPTAELAAPPDWRAAGAETSPVYGDLVRLFRLLDLADASNATSVQIDPIDISALSGRNAPLNHAERRMAQYALLNLLRRGGPRKGPSRAALLLHFVRLHPPRAIRLGYEALRKS